MSRDAMVYVVMGVTGSGKTSVGEVLAARLDVPFYDGDLFHPAANVAKMRSGIPLDDADREPWLRNLAARIREWNHEGGAVLACSALKERYRQILTGEGRARFILLAPPEPVISRRLQRRKGHFMPSALLRSQLDALEVPVEAIQVTGEGSVEENVEEILSAIRRDGA
jgi:carbohydrate kinase (thermoresistant glucokinase family)